MGETHTIGLDHVVLCGIACGKASYAAAGIYEALGVR